MFYIAKTRETPIITTQHAASHEKQQYARLISQRIRQTYQPILATSEYVQIHAHHLLYHMSQRASSSLHTDTRTCLIAVTVMTKKSGRPLVTGLVGVSTITCREKNPNVLLTTGFQAAEETKTSGNGGKRVLSPLRAEPSRGGRKGRGTREGRAQTSPGVLSSTLRRKQSLLLKTDGCPSGGKNPIRSSLKPTFDLALVGSKSVDERAVENGLHKHNSSKRGCQQACSHHRMYWRGPRQGRRTGQRPQQRIK